MRPRPRSLLYLLLGTINATIAIRFGSSRGPPPPASPSAARTARAGESSTSSDEHVYSLNRIQAIVPQRLLEPGWLFPQVSNVSDFVIDYELRSSATHGGVGIFATTFIKKGQRVVVPARGDLARILSKPEAVELFEQWSWSPTRGEQEVSEEGGAGVVPTTSIAAEHSPELRRRSSAAALENVLNLCYSRRRGADHTLFCELSDHKYMNHADKGADNVVYGATAQVAGKAGYEEGPGWAKRDIAAGEELTADYGSFDLSFPESGEVPDSRVDWLLPWFRKISGRNGYGMNVG